MKATDLMIGDLVYIHEPECKGHRIDSIDELDGQVGADGEVYDECDIRPIPLTEEILVKNGFEKYEVSKYFHEYTLNDKNYSCFEICWSSVNGFNYNGDFMLHYVHQLQHLLRLAGEGKEFEL